MIRRKTVFTTAIAAGFAAVLVACGGGGDSDTGTGTGTGTGDTIGVPPTLGSVTAASGMTVAAGTFSPDGTQFAASFVDAANAVAAVQVYDVATGAELSTLPGTDTLMGVFLGFYDGLDGLYWADDGTISAVGGFGSADWLQWNGATGELLQRAAATTDNESCRQANRLHTAYDPARNRMYAPVRNSGLVCVWDLTTQTITEYPLGGGTMTPDVVALNAAGDTLWVSFVTDALSGTVATQPYDPDTLAPLADASPSDDQAIIAASGGYHLLDSGTVLTLDTVDRKLVGQPDSGSVDVAYRGSDTVVLVEEDSKTAILDVSDGDATYIGRVDVDLSSASVLSTTGTRAALLSGNQYTFYDLSGGSTVSAFRPLPAALRGVASGTVNVDGVDQAITGSCDIFTDEGVGATGADIDGTLANGATFVMHAQNLLISLSVHYTDGGVVYDASNVDAVTEPTQILPTIAVSGSTISGTATVYDTADTATPVTIVYDVTCML